MDLDEIDKINTYLLSQVKTIISFSTAALSDIKVLSTGKQRDILTLIIKQALKGALFRPEGNGIRCHSPLHNFAKIKNKALNIRVIYSPLKMEDGIIKMQIIAVGSRDDLEAYKLAAKRL